MAAESGRTEQIISQLLLKALHVVLASRIPHLCSRDHDPSPSSSASSSSRARKRDRWFNLALGDLPSSLENLNFWHRGGGDPMVIDVLLSCASLLDPIVVERWQVQYEPGGGGGAVGVGEASAAAAFYSKTYKKSIVLVRSIYSMLRLLPAQRVYRMLTSANQSCSFSLSYKVSSFADPFSAVEENEMSHHRFTPVETQFGRISASVSYRPSLAEFNLEVAPLFPPRIISDYVGSPAADPMRAFPSSMSGKSVCATSFPLRGIARTGSLPITRPHSWTSPPLEHHPLNISPCQGPGAFHNSPTTVSGRQVTSHHPQWMPLLGGKKSGGPGHDDYRLSPPFSLSPTPSPPLYSESPLRSRLRSETAPVSIPQPASGNNLQHRLPNFSDPMRSFLPPPSPRSTRMDPSTQESPSEVRSFRKIEGFRTGDLLSTPSYTFHKGLKDGKDDSGRFSGIISSSGSPRIGFSRTSSKLSFQDDLDDCEFSCPFAVDDVDISDSQTRNLSGKDAPDVSSHKSQDAAVGVLAHMLRTAPPLRQDISCYSQSAKSEFGKDVGSSSFYASRKTSDALEELQSYKEMKELLLSQSRSKLLDSMKEIKK